VLTVPLKAATILPGSTFLARLMQDFERTHILMRGKKNVPSFQIIGAMDYATWQSSEITASQDQASRGGWVCQYAIGVVQTQLDLTGSASSPLSILG